MPVRLGFSRYTRHSEADTAMGQKIEIDSVRVVDDSIIVSTNRSLTGTDGEGFDSADAAEEAATFAASLAGRVFGADDAVRRVFVTSNVAVIAREGGWDDASTSTVSGVIENFFLFYAA